MNQDELQIEEQRPVYIYTGFLWMPQSVLFSLTHHLQASKRCCTFPGLLDDFSTVTLWVCLNFFEWWPSIFLNEKVTLGFEKFSHIKAGCKHSPELKLLEGNRSLLQVFKHKLGIGWRTLSHRLCTEGGQSQSSICLSLL